MKSSEKIAEYINGLRSLKDGDFSKIKMTSGVNKEGKYLIYVRADYFERMMKLEYMNRSIYFGFDPKGNYACCVKIGVVSPTEVEMEYYSRSKKKGNATLLAKEAIRDVFENQVYDNLKLQEGQPLTRIDSMMVGVDEKNVASMAVAKKLGFNEKGYLSMDDYYQKREEERKDSFSR